MLQIMSVWNEQLEEVERERGGARKGGGGERVTAYLARQLGCGHMHVQGASNNSCCQKGKEHISDSSSRKNLET